MHQLSKQQAKHFILQKQGLIGPHRFHQLEGITSFVKAVGCLQYDPLDICGRNADLVLFSRVKNYHKSMLNDLLYQQRALVDQWDKNMAIYSIDDWPFLSPVRLYQASQYEEQLKGLAPLIEEVKAVLLAKEYVTNQDIDIQIESHFYTWRHKKLSQAILDYLFFKGEVIIHHRVGTKRYFGLASKYLDSSLVKTACIYQDIQEFHLFQIKRRIGGVGMLGSGASDAYLGMYDVSAAQRQHYFELLLARQEIVSCQIEGIKEIMYILKEDEPYLSLLEDSKRVEFIAPLDSFIWDRKLIKKIFDFAYTWEIYTPPSKRKYGAYVLPLLYGSELIGRIEMIVDRKLKTLNVKNIWFDDDIPEGEFWSLFYARLEDFARFHDCQKIDQQNTLQHSHAR